MEVKKWIWQYLKNDTSEFWKIAWFLNLEYQIYPFNFAFLTSNLKFVEKVAEYFTQLRLKFFQNCRGQSWGDKFEG